MFRRLAVELISGLVTGLGWPRIVTLVPEPDFQWFITAGSYIGTVAGFFMYYLGERPQWTWASAKLAKAVGAWMLICMLTAAGYAILWRSPLFPTMAPLLRRDGAGYFLLVLSALFSLPLTMVAATFADRVFGGAD